MGKSYFQKGNTHRVCGPQSYHDNHLPCVMVVLQFVLRQTPHFPMSLLPKLLMFIILPQFTPCQVCNPTQIYPVLCM